MLCNAFFVRRGSGGAGVHRGGDGIVRELRFLRDGITASLLTERRTLAPHGLAGGADGARGRNTLLRKSGISGEPPAVIALPCKCKVLLNAGDLIRIETPGGGGYGAPPGGDNGGASATGDAEGAYVARPLEDGDRAALRGSSTASVALGANTVEF